MLTEAHDFMVCPVGKFTRLKEDLRTCARNKQRIGLRPAEVDGTHKITQFGRLGLRSERLNWLVQHKLKISD